MEEKIINTLLELMKTFPMHAKIIAFFFGIPVGFIGYRFITNREFRSDVISFAAKTKFKDKHIKDEIVLNKHTLFIAEPWFLSLISEISFADDDKKFMFDTILAVKTKAVIRHASVFITTDISDRSEAMEIQFKAATNAMVRAYEDEIQVKFSTKYGEVLGKTLYNLVYVKAFKKYHQKNINFVMANISLIAGSQMPINYKIYTYLNQLYAALETAIFDCEKTFRDLNGHVAEAIRVYSLTINS